MTNASLMHEAGLSKPVSGTTQRDGREVEEGSGWGDTCTRVADSCRCMAKTTIL